MKRKNHDKFFKVLSFLLLISWCLLIFFFSNQNGDSSSDSSGFVIKIINNFFRLFNPQIDILNFSYTILIIRKLAHMFLYFVLYFLAYNAMVCFNIKERKYLALLFCFIYAASDEFHQLFVINRSGEIMDVFIDTFGAFLALSLLQLFKFRKLRKNNKSL